MCSFLACFDHVSKRFMKKEENDLCEKQNCMNLQLVNIDYFGNCPNNVRFTSDKASVKLLLYLCE